MDDGALYVSGEPISAATAAIEALEGRMDTLEDDMDSLDRDLHDAIIAEQQARIDADENNTEI
jgi:hypothetical protein